MKLKVIAGYPGTPERMIAVERGELDGFCGITLSTFRSQLADQAARGKIRLIAQASTRKDKRYPDLPNILDEAKTPEARQALEFLFIPLALGRAFAAPPDTPKDRLEVLRQGGVASDAKPGIPRRGGEAAHGYRADECRRDHADRKPDLRDAAGSGRPHQIHGDALAITTARRLHRGRECGI